MSNHERRDADIESLLHLREVVLEVVDDLNTDAAGRWTWPRSLSTAVLVRVMGDELKTARVELAKLPNQIGLLEVELKTARAELAKLRNEGD